MDSSDTIYIYIYIYIYVCVCVCVCVCVNETSGFIKCGKESSMELVCWLIT